MEPNKKQKRVIQIDPAQFRRLPNGIYRAKLLEIKDGIGKYGPIYIPCFSLTESAHKNSELKDLINKNGSTALNSKLCQMIRALRPEIVIDVFEQIDLDDLLNCECYLKVEQRGIKNNAITQYFPLSDFKDID